MHLNSTGRPQAYTLFMTSVECRCSTNSCRYKMGSRGRRITRSFPETPASLLKLQLIGGATIYCRTNRNTGAAPSAQTVHTFTESWLRCSTSCLQQSVFGDEPLHALAFQKLHGPPVDLAAVLRPSERSQLLLDVLQPKIFRETKRNIYFKVLKCVSTTTIIINPTNSLRLDLFI